MYIYGNVHESTRVVPTVPHTCTGACIAYRQACDATIDRTRLCCRNMQAISGYYTTKAVECDVPLAVMAVATRDKAKIDTADISVDGNTAYWDSTEETNLARSTRVAMNMTRWADASDCFQPLKRSSFNGNKLISVMAILGGLDVSPIANPIVISMESRPWAKDPRRPQRHAAWCKMNPKSRCRGQLV
mmetsp:Transcript_22368/g.42002  ORF Transcript_22368/g.42002 Transcript_22368/m.42002 type:complete len:188 (+) Transcript_22368:101-664(+)